MPKLDDVEERIARVSARLAAVQKSRLAAVDALTGRVNQAFLTEKKRKRQAEQARVMVQTEAERLRPNIEPDSRLAKAIDKQRQEARERATDLAEVTAGTVSKVLDQTSGPNQS